MTGHDGQDSTPDRWVTRDVPGESIDYRQPEDEDGIFEVRMPIATTGEVRNEGDDPLTRDELSGMARQIEAGGVPVFLDHGASPVGVSRYSATEKVGEWADAEVQARDADDGDTDELVATARLMDPETLPSAASGIRESLAAIKEQTKRGLSLASSIAWREDADYPGGNDLMEASIVGIGADPRTTSNADAGAVALARAAGVAADSDDPGAVVERFREVVADATDSQSHDMTDDTDTSDEDTTDEAQASEADEESRDSDVLERLVDLQEQQMDTLEAIEQAVREDGEDDEDDEDDEDGEEENEGGPDDEDEEDGKEQAADTDDGAADADPDDVQELRDEVAELRESLADARDGGVTGDDVARPESDEERDTTDTDASGGDDWRNYT